MTTQAGDIFPNSNFKMMSKEGPKTVSSSDLFKGKKIVLFAVPGAFTPTCHNNHLPGYLENLELIKASGIDGVYVLSVNDVWVMDMWEKSSGAKGKIGFLSDGDATVTSALGMDVNAPGMGKRSKRYSMIVDNEIIKTINIEEQRGQATNSGASMILTQI